MPTGALFVPPSGASFAASPLSAAGVQATLSFQELAAFRTNPIEIPPSPHSNEVGLIVANSSDQLRVLHVDGIPVAWAAPGAREVVQGFHRGRYIAQWRTFLGEAVDAPTTQLVPGLTQVGLPDGGK
jgi:hypothetical protein